MSFITVAAATIPSAPLDFKGNRDRILEGIKIAKSKQVKVVVFPELSIPGYGCLDHHLEADTFIHSWEVLSEILQDPITKDILISVGMGVRHFNVRYNCQVLFSYRRIWLIRPKMSLANDGLYREMRYFSPWLKPRHTEMYDLEAVARQATGQAQVVFGDAAIFTADTSIGTETCEELFTPDNPSTRMGLAGVEVFLNASASHAELRKLATRLDLIANSTRKLGGLYVYSNVTGIDGDARIMYDGSSMIIANGQVYAQGSQFSLLPVEITAATINLEDIRGHRSNISRNLQAAAQHSYPRVDCDLDLCRSGRDLFSEDVVANKPVVIQILDPMKEIWLAEAVYLWQYLIKTRAGGFFLSLSGGLDSSTVALFVYGMAIFVLDSINAGEKQTINELRMITGEPNFTPKSPQDIVGRLLHTAYTGTVNSGDETRSRAKRLSETLGAYHSDLNIDEAITAHESIILQALKFEPQFTINGGHADESLAKQNVQARNRLVVQYELAQLSLRARQRPRAGAALLVLTSGNVDENLRGYYTKYDASSGDLAPLGSISKNDAKDFQRWASQTWNLPILQEFINARPTAELLPLSAGVQDDESDAEMGFSYDELQAFGRLRKEKKFGPWSTYRQLLSDWRDRPGFTPSKIADKTIRFFGFYGRNRHKATIVTPSVHMSGYNPDDNRHDLRPFLYPDWEWQFDKIRKDAEELEAEMDD